MEHRKYFPISLPSFSPGPPMAVAASYSSSSLLIVAGHCVRPELSNIRAEMLHVRLLGFVGTHQCIFYTFTSALGGCCNSPLSHWWVHNKGGTPVEHRHSHWCGEPGTFQRNIQQATIWRPLGADPSRGCWLFNSITQLFHFVINTTIIGHSDKHYCNYLGGEGAHSLYLHGDYHLIIYYWPHT